MLEIAVISTSGVHLGIRHSKKSYLLHQRYLQCAKWYKWWKNSNKMVKCQNAILFYTSRLIFSLVWTSHKFRVSGSCSNVLCNYKVLPIPFCHLFYSYNTRKGAKRYGGSFRTCKKLSDSLEPLERPLPRLLRYQYVAFYSWHF